jgi:hypothetical protein
MLIFSDVLLFLLLSLLLSCFIRRLFQLPKVPTAKTRRSPGHVRRPTGPTPFRPLLRSLPRVLKTPSSPSHPPPSSHVSIFIVSLPTWPSILFRFLVSLSLSLSLLRPFLSCRSLLILLSFFVPLVVPFFAYHILTPAYLFLRFLSNLLPQSFSQLDVSPFSDLSLEHKSRWAKRRGAQGSWMGWT